MATTAKQTALQAVYCAYGDDELKLRTVFSRLRERMQAYGDIELNASDFAAGSQTPLADVLTTCRTAPFFSDYRLVRLRDCEKLGKQDMQRLIDYVEAPTPTTILYLEGKGLKPDSALAKAVKAANPKALIDCTSVSAKDLPDFVRKMASDMGIQLEPAALRILVDYIGSNTVQLDNDLRKIALAHLGDGPVTANEVLSAVNPVAEVKPWDFLDAIAKRDVAEALRQVALLRKETPLRLLSLAVGRIRDLIATKCLVDRGEADRIAEETKRQSWQVTKYRQWANNFTYDELADALVKAADCEASIKSGTDDMQALTSWLIAVLSR